MPDIVAISSHTHSGDNYKRPNKRMQSDFGELALASAADAKRYISKGMTKIFYRAKY